MIIHNLNLLGAGLFPDKTNAPLVVDPNAVLSCAATLQSFQAVAGRGHKVSKFAGLMDLPKLPLRDALHVLGKAFCKPAKEETFCVAVREGADHGLI